MTRHRWVRAVWPFDMRILARRLQSNPYTDKSDAGFIIDNVRADYVRGRFVEKLSLQNTTVDPLGAVTNYDLVEYKMTHFIARTGAYGLELVDPPRSMSPFLAALSIACEDRVTITNVPTIPVAWARYLLNNFEQEGRINSVQVSKIMIGPAASGKALIVSDKDALEETESFLSGKNYSIEKIRIEFKGNLKFSAILSNSASASIIGDFNPLVVDVIRQGLYELNIKQ